MGIAMSVLCCVLCGYVSEGECAVGVSVRKGKSVLCGKCVI